MLGVVPRGHLGCLMDGCYNISVHTACLRETMRWEERKVEEDKGKMKNLLYLQQESASWHECSPGRQGSRCSKVRYSSLAPRKRVVACHHWTDPNAVSSPQVMRSVTK